MAFGEQLALSEPFLGQITQAIQRKRDADRQKQFWDNLRKGVTRGTSADPQFMGGGHDVLNTPELNQNAGQLPTGEIQANTLQNRVPQEQASPFGNINPRLIDMMQSAQVTPEQAIPLFYQQMQADQERKNRLADFNTEQGIIGAREKDVDKYRAGLRSQADRKISTYVRQDGKQIDVMQNPATGETYERESEGSVYRKPTLAKGKRYSIQKNNTTGGYVAINTADPTDVVPIDAQFVPTGDAGEVSNVQYENKGTEDKPNWVAVSKVTTKTPKQTGKKKIEGF